MANTYTYSGPATRWSEGDPTAVDYLNVSRVNSDHLYEALNTIITTASITAGAATALKDGTAATTQSPGNDTTKIATTAFVKAAVDASSTDPGGSNTEVQYNNSGAFGGSANLAWVNGTSTLTVAGTANAKILNLSASGAALASQNASKVILVDLTDPGTMWDVGQFLTRVKFCSWYTELIGTSAPPMRGAMWIDNAGTSLIWWNLDTDATYMTFQAATDKMLKGTSIADLAFLDGKIYAGGSHGIAIIDLMSDRGLVHQTGGINSNFSDIEARNAAVSAVVLTSSQGIRSDTINAVDAIRDPSAVDEFDRPKHWWAIATDDGTGGYAGGVYNPVLDEVYYSSMGADQDAMALSQSGMLWYMSDATNDDIYGYRIYNSDASPFTNSNYLGQSGWNGGSIGNSGTATIVDLAAFDAFDGYDGLAVAMSTGLDIGFIKSTSATTQNTESAHIFTTSTYQTPYMKGTRIGMYPLNDVTDRSGNGHDLTQSTSNVTFTSGPFGDTATFVASSSQELKREGDSTQNVDNTHTISFYMKTSTALSGDSGLVDLKDSGGSNRIRVYLDANETVQCICRAGGSDQYNFPGWGSGTVINDNNWHHICLTANNAIQKLYIDGVLAASESGAFTSPSGMDDLYIGSLGGGNYYTGQIAQLSISDGTDWTEAEVNLEYQRMRRGLDGAVHTLANDNVTSVRIDQNSGLAAVTTAVPSGGTAGQGATEIWDIVTGLRESIDATTPATSNDADVRLKSGATSPEYITGRSAVMEFDGQTRSIG